MLTRWVYVSDGTQRVCFKYMKPKDVDNVLAPLRTQKTLLDEKGDAATAEEKYLRYKFGRQMALKQDSVTSLIHNVAILNGLYAAFRRARAALDAALTAMEGAKFSGIFSTSASDRTVRAVMDTYYRCADASFRGQIVQVLRKTRDGLAATNVTISDCSGVEVGPFGGKAEGIVPFKPAAMVAMGRDLKAMDDDYALRAKALAKKYSGEAYLAHNTTLMYGEKPIAEAMLMRQHLDSGTTGSIHVEFSYCLSKSVDAMARVIVHEATHKFAATADFGYADKNTIARLAPAHAALNADSHAYAAMSFLLGRLVTPADLDGEPAAISQKDADLGDLDVAWRKKRGT